VRHVDVRQQNVRHELSGFAECFLAVRGFTDYLQVRMLSQAGDEAATHNWVVVREEESDSLIGPGTEASNAELRVRAEADITGRRRRRKGKGE
jgi:hypothetical protein